MILIRADGNGQLGTGHIMRCIAIASEFARSGEKCLFVTADEEPLQLLTDRGFKTYVLHTNYREPEEELEKIEKVISNYNPYAIITDSYYVSSDYFFKLREKCTLETQIVYIDDMQNDIYPCDILINYVVGSEKQKSLITSKYNAAGINCPDLLLGTEYAPLRDEFRNEMRKTLKKTVENVLILTGGSDVSHMVVQTIEYLSQNDRFGSLQFHFVIGNLNSDKEEIIEKAERLQNVYLHTNVLRMSELINSADVVISAGGTTLLEVCACGTPLIAFTCADNQKEGVQRISERTGALYAGDTRKGQDIISHIFSCLGEMNYSLRKSMSYKEQEMIDGYGTKRIIEKIIKRRNEQ